jgi:hypothetical protein
VLLVGASREGSCCFGSVVPGQRCGEAGGSTDLAGAERIATGGDRGIEIETAFDSRRWTRCGADAEIRAASRVELFSPFDSVALPRPGKCTDFWTDAYRLPADDDSAASRACRVSVSNRWLPQRSRGRCHWRLVDHRRMHGLPFPLSRLPANLAQPTIDALQRGSRNVVLPCDLDLSSSNNS